MNEYAAYYMKSLYPLQNGVLKLVRENKLPFYLTGGTAISRQYCQHRFSDDLDLFVNQDSDYPDYINHFFQLLTSNREDNPYGIDLQRIIRTESYAQFYVFEKNRPDILLKLDFVNDYA
ncbi:MAG: nucleotidyl transferase AbiEii/AbiGii toxin family protein, partial [Candidatus Delongbacteria bacterium]|nr:nucleotidyl transferase AbiEii/AbiGii toxin family protein [Candidatus Delongbacteria bacterium]